jgi:hypothetical protein
MIGFVVSPETAAAVLAGVEQAMSSRSLPNYWSPGAYPILTGAHAGQSFIPADDVMLSTPLHGKPPLTPQDFPEFAQLVGLLGGLEARIDLDPETIVQPEP